MKIIALKPDFMKELPAKCPDCPLLWCSIPLKADGETFRKDCVNKRSNRCPLMEIEVGDK